MNLLKIPLQNITLKINLKMKKILIPAIFLISISGYAQTDTISIERHSLQVSNLRKGNNRYAVWSQNTQTGIISTLSLWDRDVSFEKRGGKDVIVVKQMRYYEDTLRNKYVYTVSDRNTFKTIYDYTRRGKAGTEAYNYNDNQITGADTIAGNIKKDFKLALNPSTFCFELDVETLRMLPIKRVGQEFAINFYHPGGTVAPQYYPVKVLALEEIETFDGSKILCWKIKLNYDADDYDFSWIGKKSHEFMKLESHYPNGTFNKVKLSVK